MPPTSSIDAGADDERLRAFRQAFAEHVEVPAGALVIGEPVTVWFGLETAPDAPSPLSHARARPAGADGDIDLSRPVELVVLAVKERAARCRLLGTDSTITSLPLRGAAR